MQENKTQYDPHLQATLLALTKKTHWQLRRTSIAAMTSKETELLKSFQPIVPSIFHCKANIRV